MQAGTRAYSALSSIRPSKLPELPTPTGQNGKMTNDDITDIKLKTHQMEQERRQLKSRTQRMKQVTKERNNSIKSVFSQTQEKQAIKTASKNTLKSLRETAESLEKSLVMRQKELDELKKCDKLQVSKELQVEIQMYFLEHKRLQEKAKRMKEGENAVTGELQRFLRQLNSTRQNERAIPELQSEINTITERLFAYSKSEMKIFSSKKLKQLREHPERYDEIRKSIEEEIEKEKQQIEQNKQELELIQLKEERNTKFLQDIIDEQAQKINEQLNSQQQEEEEDI